MRIALISGDFPPRRSGVGDYTSRLALEFVNQGHQVSIWTAEVAAEKMGPVEVHSFAQPWDLNALKSVSVSIQKWIPDCTIIEYTPQSVAPKSLGVHLTFPLWVYKLKREIKKPIGITFHELNYPVGLSPRGLLLGIPQLLQFIALIFVSDVQFFTTEPVANRLSRILFWKKSLFPLAVGANIEKIGQCSKMELGLFHGQHLLVYFGGLHPTHLISYIKAAFLKARTELGSGRVKLVCIGAKSQDVEKYFSESDEKDALNDVIIFDYLSPKDVSRWLSAADLMLAPYLDGVSTRRSTAMSGFEHGKCVLTTMGASSSGSIPWEQFCAAVQVKPPHEYSNLAVTLLRDRARSEMLGSAAKSFYNRTFSWKQIAAQVLDKISLDKISRY